MRQPPDRRSGPHASTGRQTSPTDSHTVTREAVGNLLELSDLLDAQLRMRLQAFGEGWRAAEIAHADDYSAGYADGLLRRKHLEHNAVDAARIGLARWGPGGRERFADLRPGDYPGGAEGIARAKAGWEQAGFGFPHWGPGWVHLGGRFVHGNPGGHRPCTPACSAYRPGWYRIADAITILERLPGDYAATIADLRARQPAEAA